MFLRQTHDPRQPLDKGGRLTEPQVDAMFDALKAAAEHVGLFIEAANGTTFIGTPTAGANGDVSNFFVPGGFRVNFTGHDVRHADGRQLQRVGIQPHVEIAPTIQGIRAGRDEVLERALAYLHQSKGAR